jgi:ribosomally synthesized peptide (two-chain TOMM family)
MDDKSDKTNNGSGVFTGVVHPPPVYTDTAPRPGHIPMEDPLQALRCNIAWQYAWETAIALAWSSEAMEKALVENPKRFIWEHSKYEVPEGIDLHVEKTTDPAAKWNPQEGGGHWTLQKNQLTMFIPRRPPAEQQAVALAAYNATGRSYPFTGC